MSTDIELCDGTFFILIFSYIYQNISFYFQTVYIYIYILKLKKNH
jgi:hypothetical protein